MQDILDLAKCKFGTGGYCERFCAVAMQVNRALNMKLKFRGFRPAVYRNEFKWSLSAVCLALLICAISWPLFESG